MLYSMLERLGRFLGQLFRGSPPPEGEAGHGGHPQEDPLVAIRRRQEAEDMLRSKKKHPKYTEARAREVLETLGNLSSDNPLHNLRFNIETLKNNPALATTLVEIATFSQQRIDRNNINACKGAIEYYIRKLKELSYFREELSPIDAARHDVNNLGTIQDKIKTKIDQLIPRDEPYTAYRTEISNALTAADRAPQEEEDYERNKPPKKEPSLYKRPAVPILPLDFSGTYGPIDPNAPEELKPILEEVKREWDRNPTDNIYTRFTEETEADPEDPEGRRRVRRYDDRALNNLQESIQNAFRQARARTGREFQEIDVMNEVWPYLRSIVQFKKNLFERVTGRGGGRSTLTSMFGIDTTELQKQLSGMKTNERMAFMERYFYKIMRRPLSDNHEQHTRTFGLYETEAMHELLEIMQEYEGGYEYASHLMNKMYGIFAAHDAIVICEHPEGNEEAYKALTTFSRNSFTQDTMEEPIAEQLINIYERVLWDILRTFDGRIPPDWVEPTGKGQPAGNSKWDDMVKERFFQLCDAGVIFDAQRDPWGRVVKDKNNMIQWDRNNPVRRSWFDGDGRWRLLAIMQQAKGFGLLDSRLLEIFAQQRTPSFTPEIQPDWTDSDKVFSSVPYEGMARYINPVHLFTKWRMAEDRFKSYWNLIVFAGDEEHEKKWNNGVFDLNEPREVFRAMEDGTFLEKYGDVGQRFLEKYNYGRFSGRFGPWTSFGVRDAIIGMSDKEREYLGGSIRASYMNELWAKEDVKEFLAEHEYKMKFFRELEKAGKMRYKKGPDGHQHPDMDWAEKEWRRVGKHTDTTKGIYTREVMHKWQELSEKKSVKELIGELKSVYNTWTWIQMAHRSPHIVARNTYVYEDYLGKKRKRSLRDKILEEMLPGLDLEQFFNTGANPKEYHETWFRQQIAVLEGDIDIVAHAALYDESGPRNIRDDDFDRIKAYNAEGTENVAESIYRRQKAKEYYRKTKMAIAGNWDEETWKRELGIRYEGQNLVVDWNKIFDRKNMKLTGHLDDVLARAKRAAESDFAAAPYYQLDRKEIIEKRQQNLMSTEDVVWNRMELINLGYRHWARRGGDFEGHAKGLKAEVDYIVHGLRASGDMKTILEHFHKIANAYEEDDRYYSDLVVGMHAQATAKFFKQPWQFSKTGIFGKVAGLFTETSIAQKIAGRFAASWDSNKLFEFAHHIGDENLLPWKPETWLGEGPYAYSVEQLEEHVGATKVHVMWEVLTLAAFIAWFITVYRAMTAKSEEEDSEGH